MAFISLLHNTFINEVLDLNMEGGSKAHLMLHGPHLLLQLRYLGNLLEQSLLLLFFLALVLFDLKLRSSSLGCDLHEVSTDALLHCR